MKSLPSELTLQDLNFVLIFSLYGFVKKSKWSKPHENFKKFFQDKLDNFVMVKKNIFRRFMEDFNLKSHKIWVLGKIVFDTNDSRLNKLNPMTFFVLLFYFVTRLKKLNKNFIYLLDFRK